MIFGEERTLCACSFSAVAGTEPLNLSYLNSKRLPNMFVFSRSIPAVLDISGFAEIPESPQRPAAAAPASLRVLKRPPLAGDYVSVTDSSGNRVYLRQKEDTETKVKQAAVNPL